MKIPFLLVNCLFYSSLLYSFSGNTGPASLAAKCISFSYYSRSTCFYFFQLVHMKSTSSKFSPVPFYHQYRCLSTCLTTAELLPRPTQNLLNVLVGPAPLGLLAGY